MLRRHYEYIYKKLAENCNVCPVIIKITQLGQNMSQVSFIEVNSTLKSLYLQSCKSSLQSHHLRLTLYDHTCDPCLICVICVCLYSLQCTLYFQPSVIIFVLFCLIINQSRINVAHVTSYIIYSITNVIYSITNMIYSITNMIYNIIIENRIYREEFTRKKYKTAIFLYCFTYLCVLHIFMLYNLLGPGIS